VVTIASALTAIPNPAIVGQEVQFLVQAQGNPPLNFIWDFGDGTSAVGPNPIHIYSAVGTYTVLLTVVDASNATVTATISVVIIEANGDSDGDGFSNAVEVSLLSDPTSALSTPFNLPPPKAGGPVKTLRAKVQLSFGAPRQDQIFVSGFLPVPSGFQINGQIVIADIGNVVRAFVLDQSGNARVSTAPNSSPNDILRVRASKGGVRKFQLTIGHGTFQKIFANEPSVAQDLTNEKAGTFTKTVRVAIYFNGSKYESLINGTFRVNRHKLVGIFGK
jgi:PKD repeat protein